MACCSACSDQHQVGGLNEDGRSENLNNSAIRLTPADNDARNYGGMEGDSNDLVKR